MASFSAIMKLTLLLMLTALFEASFSERYTTDTEPYTPRYDSRQVLYVLVTGPYPDPLDNGWDSGISLIPAVRLAFNQINNRTDILHDYKLQAIEDDSGCAVRTKAVNSFVSHVYYSKKQIVGIIGPACSGPALALAPLLSRADVSLIQIAPTATSPLIEALDYNTTFTMVAPALRFINSFIALMKHNNWTKVVTLYDDSRDVFRSTNSKLLERFNSIESIDVAYTSNVFDGLQASYFPLDRVIRSRVRVVLLLMETSTAKKILCLAFHLNMLYPNYQWVFSQRNTKSELEMPLTPFHYRGIQYNCSQEMLATALNGAVLNLYKLDQDDDTLLSPSNITYKEYRYLYNEEFWKHLKEPKIQRILAQSTKDVMSYLPSGNLENAYYDAAWVLGMALERTSSAAVNGGLNLSQYSYGEPEATQSLADNLQRIEFEGATGQIKFGLSKSIPTTIVISQLWNNPDSSLIETVVAYYSKNKLQFLEHSNYSFIRDTFHQSPIRIHLALGIFVIVVAGAVAILTALLQITFIVWHDKTSIKATSPNISHLIFSGCYLFALATFLFSIQQSFELESALMELFYSILCNTIMWCLFLGYSLIFGTVFVKVWRMYKLFKHFKNSRPGVYLTDNALTLAVVSLLVIDTVICLIWNIVYPWLIVRTDSYNGLKAGVPTIFISLSCECTNMYYLVGAVAVYKGTIAILLLVFSILNRKIRRKNFSHTRKVNILVYSIILLIGGGFPMYFLLLNTNIYLSFVVLCAILMLTAVMCFLMLFIPPVILELKIALRKNTLTSNTEATIID